MYPGPTTFINIIIENGDFRHPSLSFHHTKKNSSSYFCLDPTIETIKHHCVKDSSVKMIFFFDNAKANLFWMDL